MKCSCLCQKLTTSVLFFDEALAECHSRGPVFLTHSVEQTAFVSVWRMSKVDKEVEEEVDKNALYNVYDVAVVKVINR